MNIDGASVRNGVLRSRGQLLKFKTTVWTKVAELVD